MGDIADSLIDGELDFYSGEYIGPGVGYPRTMYNEGFDPVRGVVNFLNINGFNKPDDRRNLIEKYSGKTVNNEEDIKNICIEIQKDFKKFKNFIRSEKNQNSLK